MTDSLQSHFPFLIFHFVICHQVQRWALTMRMKNDKWKMENCLSNDGTSDWAEVHG